MTMLKRIWLVATLVALTSTAIAGPSPRYAEEASDAVEALPLEAGYALDPVSRDIPATGRFTCPDTELVPYKGTSIKLQKAVRLQPAFIPRVQEFEKVVIEVATRVYGRAPVRIVHLGGYVCRRMKTYPTYLSEHAMGDAIDIAGFDFGPASKAQRKAAPKGTTGAFQVRVDKHWTADKGTAALHARFLRELADALIARPDIFRVMLGPSYPGHQNHFHFDTSNFRKIDI